MPFIWQKNGANQLDTRRRVSNTVATARPPVPLSGKLPCLTDFFPTQISEGFKGGYDELLYEAQRKGEYTSMGTYSTVQLSSSSRLELLKQFAKCWKLHTSCAQLKLVTRHHTLDTLPKFVLLLSLWRPGQCIVGYSAAAAFTNHSLPRCVPEFTTLNSQIFTRTWRSRTS